MMTKTTFWNDIYKSGRTYDQITEDLVARILKRANELGGGINSALDVGCGRGELVGQLINYGIETTGIDLSPFAIKEAKKNYPNGMFFDVSLAEYDGKSVDLITAKFVYAVVGVSKIDFLKDIQTNLNPNGVFALITPIKEKGQSVPDKYAGISVYPNEVEQELKSVFSKVELFIQADLGEYRKRHIYLAS